MKISYFKKLLLSLLSIILLFSALFSHTGCSQASDHKNKPTINIAVAASTFEAMKTIAEDFQARSHIKIEIIHASSGKLASQITQSAPYCVFFSADEIYPNFLIDQGFGVKPAIVYAQGFLHLWVGDKDQQNKSIDEILLNDKIQKIALANTTTAPYGKVAYEWLQQNELLPQLEEKLVFGESITQVNTYIMTNTVDAAFTTPSSLQHINSKVKDHLIPLHPSEYTPIRQSMVITKFGQENFPEESLSFANFVQSKHGQLILKRYGFSCP